ncbi:MAG: chloride channel protein [Pirellulaceae bacterium]
MVRGRDSLWEDIRQRLRRLTRVPAVPLTIILACFIGIAGGYGAVFFTFLINLVERLSLVPALELASRHPAATGLLCLVPAGGLLSVAWMTRRFAPEAQGHGVPEVIFAVARQDGVIRPRVSVVKILASGICIGTGGSAGREGPIVQIGSSLGSVAGQYFKLPARHIKVLVAAGAAAGISATFNAPLAGVMFSSEIILGSFAVESLTPIVIASVVADVVQGHVGEHGMHPAFRQLDYDFLGAWEQLPSHFLLGLLCGIMAVGFTKLVYVAEDVSERWLPNWPLRALVLGTIIGIVCALYPAYPPTLSSAGEHERGAGQHRMPALFGVGYETVDHTLHLETVDRDDRDVSDVAAADRDKTVRLERADMLRELWWLLPLIFLKPIMTSLTLAGGGSGGIFAPSLFIGATLGASFGLLCNLVLPGASANPGVYAIVGMGAVVAGTTHGVLSAILVVYEMTNDSGIILPIMIAAGLASVLARFIDPGSIYTKKITRRGESIARGHEMHRLEHIMVRDVMIRQFPTVKQRDDVTEIVRVARANPTIESLPVMSDDGNLVGIIRPEDLHRVLDSDLPPQLVHADDVAVNAPLSVSPDENLLEALRDFGSRDIETLPVEVGSGSSRRLIGLLLRADVMRRYRHEMLEMR